jgi:hypothetical protein
LYAAPQTTPTAIAAAAQRLAFFFVFIASASFFLFIRVVFAILMKIFFEYYQ